MEDKKTIYAKVEEPQVLRVPVTFEDIKRVNETIKTTDIKGKDYAEVNQRIKAFKMLYPTGTITTKMKSNENGVCVFRAYVYDDESKLLATGTAYEKESSSFINKTSYIENCETSAVGRALGLAGFGIDTSIASAEEVANAMENQNKNTYKKQEDKTDYKKLLEKLLDEQGIDKASFCKEKKLSVRSSQERFKVEYELLKKETSKEVK